MSLHNLSSGELGLADFFPMAIDCQIVKLREVHKSKRLLIHSAVVFVVFSLYGFVVRGILLEGTYNKVPGPIKPC